MFLQILLKFLSEFKYEVENLLFTGVIIFGSDQEVGELMKAVGRLKATGQFSWIGSDGWGGRGLAYLGKEAQVYRYFSLEGDFKYVCAY